MLRTRRHRPRDRRGSILILSAILMVAMLAMIAFAVDVGYLQLARTQLQQAADSAAIAATMELVDKGMTATPDLTAETASARQIAVQYAASNPICSAAPTVDPNTGNGTSGDVVVGYLQDPSDQSQEMDFSDPHRANAVRVRVQRTSGTNGEVDLFFGRIFGRTGQAVTASATAALLNNISGFKAPASGGNLGILPFALDEQTWNDLMSGGGNDAWTWDPENSWVSHGADGVREVNLYPQGTGSPGNRGTVDIGSNNNSTSDIARQILNGVTPADLAQLPGGALALNGDGECTLNGDTGISAGVKDELAAIKGQPRVIPIFRSVTGPGNNAQYLIVKFVGVRVLDVKLTGPMSGKLVTVQPANIRIEGAIPGGESRTSSFVYSPVWLVR